MEAPSLSLLLRFLEGAAAASASLALLLFLPVFSFFSFLLFLDFLSDLCRLRSEPLSEDDSPMRQLGCGNCVGGGASLCASQRLASVAGACAAVRRGCEALQPRAA